MLSSQPATCQHRLGPRGYVIGRNKGSLKGALTVQRAAPFLSPARGRLTGPGQSENSDQLVSRLRRSRLHPCDPAARRIGGQRHSGSLHFKKGQISTATFQISPLENRGRSLTSAPPALRHAYHAPLHRPSMDATPDARRSSAPDSSVTFPREQLFFR